MSREGAQHNETFGGWHEMRRRDTSLVKSNGSKTSSLLDKVSNTPTS